MVSICKMVDMRKVFLQEDKTAIELEAEVWVCPAFASSPVQARRCAQFNIVTGFARLPISTRRKRE